MYMNFKLKPLIRYNALTATILIPYRTIIINFPSISLFTLIDFVWLFMLHHTYEMVSFFSAKICIVTNNQKVPCLPNTYIV